MKILVVEDNELHYTPNVKILTPPASVKNGISSIKKLVKSDVMMHVLEDSR